LEWLRTLMPFVAQVRGGFWRPLYGLCLAAEYGQPLVLLFPDFNSPSTTVPGHL
jgi:hypothetical protein